MSDRLILLLVIVGVAWLIDRGWGAFGKRVLDAKPKPRPPQPTKENSQEATSGQTRSQSSALRGDWLRLGRRSK